MMRIFRPMSIYTKPFSALKRGGGCPAERRRTEQPVGGGEEDGIATAKNGGGRFNSLRATQPDLKIRQFAAATGVQDDLIPRSGYPVFYKLNAKKQIQHDTQFITLIFRYNTTKHPIATAQHTLNNSIFCKTCICFFAKTLEYYRDCRSKHTAPVRRAGFHFDEPQARCYHSTVAIHHLPPDINRQPQGTNP